jgi:hypothetical protein
MIAMILVPALSLAIFCGGVALAFLSWLKRLSPGRLRRRARVGRALEAPVCYLSWIENGRGRAAPGGDLPFSAHDRRKDLSEAVSGRFGLRRARTKRIHFAPRSGQRSCGRSRRKRPSPRQSVHQRG